MTIPRSKKPATAIRLIKYPDLKITVNKQNNSAANLSH